MIHCHGTFSDRKFQILGGHVKKLVISATGEVVITSLMGKMVRAFDEETGLNLLTNA